MILAASLFLSYCGISIVQSGQKRTYYNYRQEMGLLGGRPSNDLIASAGRRAHLYYSKVGVPLFSQGEAGNSGQTKTLMDVHYRAIFHYSAGHLSQALAEAVANGEDLADANLDNQSLNGLYLVQARLSGASMKCCNLSFANLTRSNLQGALLNNANLRHCNLRYANLQGAHLGGANLEGVGLYGSVLRDVVLDGAVVTKEMLVKSASGPSESPGSRDPDTGQNWRERLQKDDEDRERFKRESEDRERLKRGSEAKERLQQGSKYAEHSKKVRDVLEQIKREREDKQGLPG